MSQQGTGASHSLVRDGTWFKSEEKVEFPWPIQCDVTCSPHSTCLLCVAILGLAGVKLTFPIAALLVLCSVFVASTVLMCLIASRLSFKSSLKDQ